MLLDDYLDAVAKYDLLNVKNNSLLTYLASKSRFWGLCDVKNGKIFSLDGGSYSDKNLVVAISEFEEKNKHCATIIAPAVEESNRYVQKIWRVL